MIEIDGSYGEGGGAILRQALGLAAHAGEAIRVVSIRAGRPKPGLKAQHIKAVEAIAAVTGARVEGLEPRSTELTFEPGALRGGTYRFDIGTAGSMTLLIQTVLVPCLCGEGSYEFELVGGTDVAWSPPADYLARVTLPVLRRFGEADLAIARRGYYPKGGGRLLIRLRGGSGPPEPLVLDEPGRVERVRGVSHASRSLEDRDVAERQEESARRALEPLGVPVLVEVEYAEAYGLGSGITLWTEAADGPPLGGDALGARGVSAEKVGRNAASKLSRELSAGACVDRYLADQLVPFLAVSGGSFVTSEITEHARSNIYVAERILGVEFAVEGTRVSCEV